MLVHCYISVLVIGDCNLLLSLFKKFKYASNCDKKNKFPFNSEILTLYDKFLFFMQLAIYIQNETKLNTAYI